MIKIRQFNITDIDNISAQQEQKFETGLYEPSPKQEPYTIFDDETNMIIAILIFTELTEERFAISSLISADAGKYFVSLREIVFKFIDEYYAVPRLECVVHTSFTQGHRLMKLLGFKKEADMKKFFKGETYSLYARIK